MFEKVFEHFYDSMYAELDRLSAQTETSPERLEASLKCIEDTMEMLFAYLDAHPISDEPAEINFFKYVKPKFQSWQIYVLELHQLLVAEPIGTREVVNTYYKDELAAIERFFKRHLFLYQYYVTGEDAKDAAFFLRKNIGKFPLGQESVSGRLRRYSSSMDFMFAKFRAMEMTRDFILSRLKLLENRYEELALSTALKRKRRWWSGDKAELVELVYGLYLTGRINDGKADIGEIIEWLEDSLNIDLRQAYRIFLDIKRRKKISHTKFLDEMSKAIERSIQTGNS
ncbi:RteC domain-containing protein [Sphingobacterium bambusae]|uniref:RteC domain-containing protein n=1 Tax=Sphingobacterium bambusae TaxID=662858 RepID=A0ABW6BB54_9SPHI|nr:RteC domain-containing protein [Sphingobacterium bambusae]WPL48470.1 RteC domain-containing protein [Sphingobacterium bambusae]